jgi:hypothetical protein
MYTDFPSWSSDRLSLLISGMDSKSDPKCIMRNTLTSLRNFPDYVVSTMSTKKHVILSWTCSRLVLTTIVTPESICLSFDILDKTISSEQQVTLDYAKTAIKEFTQPLVY